MSIKNSELSRISVIKSDEVHRLSRTSSIPLDFLEEVSDSLPNRPLRPTRNEDNQRQQDTTGTGSLDHAALSIAVAQAVKDADEQHARTMADLHDKHAEELASLSEQNEAQLRRLATDVATAVAAADASVQEFFASAQPAMIDLSISIADTLTGVGFDDTSDALQRRSNIDAIKSSVSWAIEELSRDQSIDIYLNPDTLHTLDDTVELETLSHGARLRWHARPELAADDWVASSPQTTLRRVRKEIIDRIRSILTESLASAGSAPDTSTLDDDMESQSNKPEALTTDLRGVDADAAPAEDLTSGSGELANSQPTDLPFSEESQERKHDEDPEND